MANITAAEVNKLRKMTGAGMMDCKKALVETEGDFEKAIDKIQKKGQKVASKRADKEANEGIVLAQTTTDNKYGVVFMLNCETDFVAKNDEFVNFANGIMEKALSEKPASVEDLKALKLNDCTVEENITEMVGKTGEKMDLSGFEVIEAEKVFAYNHMGNKLATVLGLNKANGVDEAGHGQGVGAGVQAGLLFHLAQGRGQHQPVGLHRGVVPVEGLDVAAEAHRPQAAEPRLGVLGAALVAEHAGVVARAALQHQVGDELLVVGVVLHVVALGEEEVRPQAVEVDRVGGQEALGAEAWEEVSTVDDQDGAHGGAFPGRDCGSDASDAPI